jgi:uncharacterized protein YjbI with pentapeptide repeats
MLKAKGKGTPITEQEKEPDKRPSGWKRLWARTGFGDKTLWDFLQLLIVPLVLAVIGLWFAAQQDARQQQIEDDRAQQAQKIENQRAEAERELAVQRAQDEALQAYLNQMSNLLLEKNLRESEEDSEVRSLARARTLTALGRLDPSRKRAVMTFLAETKLIQSVDEKAPIIRLGGADLHGTNLVGLIPAPRGQLHGADLSFADLSNAALSQLDISDASLFAANLSDAHLRSAFLTGAELTGADLSGTDLMFADLSKSDLGGTILRDAKLLGAEGITREELEQQGAYLGGATMPNGTVLPEGYYAARYFQPALSLSFSQQGWTHAPGPQEMSTPGWGEESRILPFVMETTDELSAERSEGGQLNFTNPSHVFDPSNPSEAKEVPEPENAEEWVSWIQRHPNLDISEPVSVRVGGLSGKQIDVTASSTPKNYSREICGQKPCVPLYPTSTSATISYPSDKGWEDRYVIVDVEGETVVINFSAPADEFDASFQKAQKLLDTVEWVGH